MKTGIFLLEQLFKINVIVISNFAIFCVFADRVNGFHLDLTKSMF